MESDAFPTTDVRVVTQIMNVGAVLTLLVCVLLFYLVLFKSPKVMQTCKYYLLGYVVCSAGGEVALVCLKPIMLEPLPIFYLNGWLCHMSSAEAAFFTLGTAGWGYCFLVCYSTLILDRILATTLLNHRQRIVFGGFVLWLVGGLGALAVTAYQAVEAEVIMQPETIVKQVKEHFPDAPALFRSQRALLGLSVPNSTPFFVITFLGFAAFVVVACGMPAVFILFMLLQRFKSIPLAPRTRRFNLAILRLCIAQLVGAALFFALPFVIIGGVTILLHVEFHIEQYCIMMLTFFFNYDMTLLILCIRPYREVIVNFVTWRKLSKTTNQSTAHSTKEFKQVNVAPLNDPCALPVVLSGFPSSFSKSRAATAPFTPKI